MDLGLIFQSSYLVPSGVDRHLITRCGAQKYEFIWILISLSETIKVTITAAVAFISWR